MGGYRKIVGAAAVFLIAYHAMNFFHRGEFHPYRPLSKSFQLKMGDRLLLQIPGYELVPRLDLDYPSWLIGSLGYIARYETGNFPLSLVAPTRQPALQLVQRQGAEYQFRENLSREVHCSRFYNELPDWIREHQAKVGSLLLVPIPTKTSVLREKLFAENPLPRPSQWSVRYPNEPEDARAAYGLLVDKFPNQSLDLYQTFRNYLRDNPESDLYLPSDSHLTSLGLAVTAQAIIRRLGEMGWFVPSTEIKRTDLAPVQYSYPFLNHLRLPPYFADHRPELQWQEPKFELVGRWSRGPGKRVQRLIFVGTSISQRWEKSRYGVAEMIANTVHTPLIRSIGADWGRTGGLKRLSAKLDALKKSDILIWEFPFEQISLPLEHSIPRL